MELAEFIDIIGGETYKDDVLSYPVEAEYLELFYKDFPSFEAEGKKQENSGLFFLSSYARLACASIDESRRRGIPDSIMFGTFFDITIWERWYERQNGMAGLDRINWIRNHILFRLFRLGDLQFEISGEKRCALPVFHVHVPEGARLDGAEDSFARALSFFKEEKAFFTIESWLLSPQINRMLSASSSIRKFSSLFTLDKTEESRQAEERVFGFIASDPSSYPVSSSLSKKVKEHLLSGGKIENGYGFLVRPSR